MTELLIRKGERNTWWTPELSILWNDLCETEKLMLRSNSQAKVNYRESFKCKRKEFAKTVQREKRKHWYHKQIKIERQTDEDSKEFWKKMGRTGVGRDGKRIFLWKCTPMTVLFQGTQPPF